MKFDDQQMVEAAQKGASIVTLEELERNESPFLDFDFSPFIDSLESKHRLQGTLASNSGHTILLVKYLAGSRWKHDDASELAAITYGWCDDIGAALTFTFGVNTSNSRKIVGRGYIDQADPLLDSLIRLPFYVAFVSGKRILKICKVAVMDGILKDGLIVAINNVKSHCTKDYVPSLFYWDLLASSPTWDKVLLPSDFLSISWINHYKAELRLLRKMVEDIRPEFDRQKEHLHILPPMIKSLIEVFFLEGFTPAINLLHKYSGEGLVGQLFDGQNLLMDSGYFEKMHCIVSQLFRLFMDSPGSTLCGQRLCWIEGANGSFKFTQIEIVDRGVEEIKTYWANLLRDLKVDRGHLVSGSDFPATYEMESAGWEKFNNSGNAEESLSLVDALLEEASSNKKWVIPFRAKVVIKLGIFEYMEITELGDEVYFVLWDSEGKYQICSTNPFTRNWAIELKKSKSTENDNSSEIALKLILASIIRDFWVVEERRTLFQRKYESNSLGIHKTRVPYTGPVVVYLPRARYISDPDVGKCSQSLMLEDRRKHFVKAHLRKSKTASENQLQLAQLYGIAVNEGFTFVRPHERGGAAEREVIYRSRSASQLLFGEQILGTDNVQPDWFEFEKDVRIVLEENGFKIVRVAAPGKGDYGVDIFATKRTSGLEVQWVIQCKCYSERKVGPAHVRELLGSMQKYSGNVQAAIFTTSQFSMGAIDEANASGIKLVNGEEFLRLVNRKITILELFE